MFVARGDKFYSKLLFVCPLCGKMKITFVARSIVYSYILNCFLIALENKKSVNIRKGFIKFSMR